LFAENPGITTIRMPLASDVTLLHLLKDGIVVRGITSPSLDLLVPNAVSGSIDFTGKHDFYSITDKGRELVKRLAEAHDLDAERR
jgi:hypothetical protein